MELTQFQLQCQYQKLICNFQKQQLNLIIINFKEHQFYFQKTLNSQNFQQEGNQLHKLFKSPHQLFEQLKKAFYFNLLTIQYNQVCIQSQAHKKQQMKCLPLKKVKTTHFEKYAINKMNQNANKKHKNQVKKDIKQEKEDIKMQKLQKQESNFISSNLDIQQQMMMNHQTKQKKQSYQKKQQSTHKKSIRQTQFKEQKSKTYIQEKSTTLFIGNLSYNATLQSMSEFFSQAGKVKQVRIVRDKATGKSKGFGFVDYFNIQTAKRAYQLLNGKTFSQKKIRIDWSNSKDI